MDLEQLSKTQVVLLTLLVSFMTSMATGIVTVSLMQQAPSIVAQTVNRIIEETVQEVKSPGSVAAASVATDHTAQVSGSGQIASAVAAATPSVVRLYSNGASDKTFLGLGAVVSSTGAVMTDTAALGSAPEVTAELPGGQSVRMFVTSRDDDSGIAYLSPATSSATSSVSWHPFRVAAQQPSLGTSAVLLSGEKTAKIGAGIITSASAAGTSALAIDETDISSDNVMYGSSLIDLGGALIGLSTEVSREHAANGFIDLASVAASQATTSTPAKETSMTTQ